MLQNYILYRQFIKTVIFLIVFFPQAIFSQIGWLSNPVNNSAYLWNGTNNNVNVGLGLNNPSAQLHTNGTVRFEGLTDLPSSNRILVTDDQGYIYWRNATPSESGDGWLLEGNTASNTDFLGTINKEELRFRTNNIQWMKIASDGNLMLNSQVLPAFNPNKKLTIHTNNSVNYTTVIDATSYNGVPDGIMLANTTTKSTPGHGVSLTFLSSAGSGNGWGAAIINGVTVGSNQMDLTFQVEENNNNSGSNPNPVTEAMRITHHRRVGIGTAVPTTILHVSCANKPVRFENLPVNSGTPLVIDANGNIYKSNMPAANNVEIQALKNEIDVLKNEIQNIKNILQGNNNSSESKFTVYPNPAQSFINVNYNISREFKNAYIQIVDTNGKVVHKFDITTSGGSNKMVNCQNWINGIYYCSLKIDDKIETQTFSIVK